MSLKYIVTVICIVSLLALFAGCTSNTDPLVGTWKQDTTFFTVTMDLKADGTGTLTTDTSAMGAGTESKPSVVSMGIKWEKVNDTCINVYSASDASMEHLLLNYDKDNNCLWESPRISQMDFHKA